jgi:hypothetical protein
MECIFAGLLVTDKGDKSFADKIQDQKKLLSGRASPDAHIKEPAGNEGSK